MTPLTYDYQGRLIGVYTPNGTGGLDVVEELVYLDGWRTVATIRPDATLGMGSPVVYPIVSDHLGSPRKILDQTGTLLWSWTNTEPYGYQAPNELHSGSSFAYDGRFPGQRFDRSTGSLHNGFRTYSPKLGRYIQSDPLGLAAGWNTYAYSEGNPVDESDPSGLLLLIKPGTSSRDVNAIWRAIQNLRKVPGYDRIIDDLHGSKEIYWIDTDRNIPGNGEYAPENNTVYWNPNRGVDFSGSSGCAGYASPTFILGHELMHPWLRLKRKDIPSNAHDDYIIRGYERAYYRVYGGLKRNSHSASNLVQYYTNDLLGGPR